MAAVTLVAALAGVGCSEPGSGSIPAARVDGVAVGGHAPLAFRREGRGHLGGRPGLWARVRDGALEILPQGHSPAASAGPLRAAATFETVGVERGGRALALSAPRASLADGTLRMDRGAVLEELVLGDDGVEQRWTFERKPEGEGDLTVRVRVGGSQLEAESVGGLHLRDRRTGAGVRYGCALWIDAAGKATGAKESFREGEIVLRVPAAVAEASRYPAVLDPTISAETELTLPVAGVSPTSGAVVGFDGTNYLVVWVDGRSPSGALLYGARISPDGTLLDPNGIPIAAGPGWPSHPGIAFDGAQFLLVWTTARDVDGVLLGLRILPDGTAIDAAPIEISAAPGSQAWYPSVAYGAGTFLVAWTDGRNGTFADVYAARVGLDGSVTDPSGIRVSSPAASQENPVVTFMADSFLVVWRRTTAGRVESIFAARVQPDGALLDGGGFDVSNVTGISVDAPAVAFDGANCLVLWSDFRNSNQFDIYGTRVRPDATVLDPAGIRLTSDAAEQAYPAVAFDGAVFQVVWADSRSTSTRDIFRSRVRPDGTVLDPDGLWTDTTNLPMNVWMDRGLVLQAGGGNTLLAWNDDLTQGTFGRRLASSGAPLEATAFPISNASPAQQVVAAAFDGTNCLVVWFEFGRDAGPTQLRAARVAPDGRSLDSGGILITADADLFPLLPPGVAFAASTFLVTWVSVGGATPTLHGARILPDGTLLDPQAISIASSSEMIAGAAVASSGGEFLVGWSDARNGPGTLYPFVARVSDTGVVLDPGGIALPADSPAAEFPAISFDGTNYLVVWDDSTRILASRVAPDGTVLDAGPLVLSTSTGGPSRFFARTAFDGTRHLVVWLEGDATSGQFRVVGTRVAVDGTVLDPVAIVFPSGVVDAFAGYLSLPVAFTGATFLVAWVESGVAGSDIRGARLSPTGVLLDPAGLSLAAGAADQMMPVLAAGPPGQALLAYSTFVAEPPYGSLRARSRLYVDGLRGNPCGAAAECMSGFCVDRVCCDGACGGGTVDDCQACSVAAGAAADGTCGRVEAGRVCRPAADLCDLADACDGVAPDCPTDAWAADGAGCAQGVCQARVCAASPPRLTLPPAEPARCFTAFAYQPAAVGTPPLRWSLVGGPTGMAIDLETGALSWTPEPGEASPVEVAVLVENDLGSDQGTLAVEVVCHNPVTLKLGCGCGGGGPEVQAAGSLAGLLIVAGIAGARRRRLTA